MSDFSFLHGALAGIVPFILLQAALPPGWERASAGTTGQPGPLMLRQGWGWWPLPVLLSYLMGFGVFLPILGLGAPLGRSLLIGAGLGTGLLLLWVEARWEQRQRLRIQGTQGAVPLFAAVTLKSLCVVLLILREAPGPVLALATFGAFALQALAESRAALQAVDRQRAEAADAAWRTRLAPHFLFNVLNTLGAQIGRDPQGAQATTEQLGRLFRQLLALSQRPTVTLGEELAFVEDLLALHRARLGARLKVELHIPEVLEALELPTLALQTLVENALKHGIEPLEAAGLVRLRAWTEAVYGDFRTFTDLHLSVESPLGPGVTEGTGMGLESLRARLEHPEDLTITRTEATFTASFRWRQPA